MKTLAIAIFALIGVSTAANAATTFLATDDFVGISFLANINGYVSSYSVFLYGTG